MRDPKATTAPESFGPVDSLLSSATGSWGTLPSPDTSPGTLPGMVDDRFELIRLLGRGGMGEVWLARDLRLGRRVAIKLVDLPEFFPRRAEKHRRLFAREAQVTAQLQHPNIVTVYHSGTLEGRPYLVLELLRGESLFERCQKTPLSLYEITDLGAQIAGALAYAHGRGVVHRDLKPANLFLSVDGRVRVLDYGLAGLGEADPGEDTDPLPPRGETDTDEIHTPPAPTTSDARAAGTPGYMSPEQQRGAKPHPAMDIWGLGTVLFELIAGRRALRAEALAGHERADLEVPRELTILVDRMRAREAELRPEAEEVAATLRRLRGERAEGDERPPYRYLETFGAQDESWFFGRERESARLVAMLDQRALVAIVGPAGAGKSSLARAGVIGRLRQRAAPPKTLEISPGREPLRTLAERLTDLHTDAGLPTSGRAELDEAPGEAGRLLRAWARATGRRVLLVVDQLEELFTQVDDPRERARFAAALCSAADDPRGSVRVLVTLREDFLSRLAEVPELCELVQANLLLLGPPDASALLEALTGPAARVGVSLEEGLASRIVEELAGMPAPLPFLQVTASHLYAQRDRAGGRMTWAAFERLGGVGGVLARHADQVIEQVGHTGLARDLLIQLVTPEGTRRRVGVEILLARLDASAQGARVLEQLVTGRLLTTTDSEGRRMVELAHDLLIQHWDRLEQWLGADEEARRALDRLEHATAAWLEAGEPAGLLWSGEALARSQRLKDAGRLTLSPDELRFLGTCEARVRRDRRLGRSLVLAAVLFLVAATAVSWGGLVRYRAQEQEARAAAAVATTRALGAEAGRAAQDGRDGEALALRRAAWETAKAASTSEEKLDLALMEAANLAVPAVEIPGVLHSSERLVVPSEGAPAVVVQADDQLALVDPSTGEITCRVPLAVGAGPELAVSPDGRLAVVAGAEPSAVVVDLEACTAGPRLAFPHDSGGRRLALSADGRFVAGRGVQGEILTFDLSTGDRLGAAHPDSYVVTLAWFPDRPVLATGHGDGTVQLWDEALHPLSSWAAHEGPVWELGPTPDGTRLATASWDATAAIWEVEGGRLLHRLEGHEGRLWGLSWSADARLLATSSDDGTVRVWDATRGGQALHVFRDHRGPVFDLAFAPSGAALLTGGVDQRVHLYDAEAGTLLARNRDHRGVVWRVGWSADGARPGSLSGEESMRLWRWSPARTGWRQQLGAGRIYNLIFADPWLVATSSKGVVHVLGMDDGRSIRTLDPADGPLLTVSGVADDGLLIMAGKEGELIARELPQLEERWRIQAHPSPAIRLLRVKGRLDLLVSVSANELATWRSADGGALSRAEIEGELRWAELSADARRLWVVRTDGEVLQFQLSSEGLFEGPPAHLGKLEGQLRTLIMSPDHLTWATQHGEVERIALDGWRSLWRSRLGSLATSQLSLVGDPLQVAVAQEDGGVALLSAQTGEVLWQEPPTDGTSSVSPAGEDRILIITQDGGTHLRSLEDGALLNAQTRRGTAKEGCGVDPRTGHTIVVDNDGVLEALPPLSPIQPTELMVQSGAGSNLRVCPGSFAVVAVQPWPAAEGVWAPAEACR